MPVHDICDYRNKLRKPTERERDEPSLRSNVVFDCLSLVRVDFCSLTVLCCSVIPGVVYPVGFDVGGSAALV